ncbi:MAG: ATP-grasp domain-containing protein [Planctomycetes bacterium]|nr:ATP-grasp domain-containing protein [Planctomycetota bacterium]
MLNVIMISPGFPAEMPHFARGLKTVGASVLGIGDQPQGALDPMARESLDAYLQVHNLWDEEAVVKATVERVRGQKIDRVECLWEPGMVLAARVREALGVEGLGVEQTIPFRDKVRMKEVLAQAGVRIPRFARARNAAEVRAAAKHCGYPLIIKPIDGAGSADTYTCRDDAELERSLGLVQHVKELTVEEFIDGEEFTFDTICSEGRILFENVGWYRPKPLVARLNDWISPQCIVLRDLEAPHVKQGRELGRAVLEAMGFRSGFTHMEWFYTHKGEAVFGEIGARAPGARLVHMMNYSVDADLFVAWAEAVCHGRISQDTSKKYNGAMVFKRASGPGRVVTRVEGLESLMARYGEHVCNLEVVRKGEPRRDFRQVLVGDGWIACRHPDLAFTADMVDAFGSQLSIHAD